MDEAEWLRQTDPRRMLDYLEVYHRIARTRNGRRKLRLFACACCRRAWQASGGQKGKPVVEVLERYADGLAEWEDVREAVESERTATPPGWDRLWDVAQRAAAYRPQDATDLHSLFSYSHWDVGGPTRLCGLLRELFGNPFRPLPALPAAVLAWNDRLVPRLAQAAYGERRLPEGTLDPMRLGILADALLDAGCVDDTLPAHLRNPEPHFRGCFALDRILEKG
ncbi:MAG TPA: hypothetical protein VFW33_17715 [Gemmataceae bacterium]|nr:hypothetical protein [Gemmataceae bacterium]